MNIELSSITQKYINNIHYLYEKFKTTNNLIIQFLNALFDNYSFKYSNYFIETNIRNFSKFNERTYEEVHDEINYLNYLSFLKSYIIIKDNKDDTIKEKGKYVKSNGEYYIGEFSKGKFEGKGKYVFTKEKYYEGEFKENLMETEF